MLVTKLLAHSVYKSKFWRNQKWWKTKNQSKLLAYSVHLYIEQELNFSLLVEFLKEAYMAADLLFLDLVEIDSLL